MRNYRDHLSVLVLLLMSLLLVGCSVVDPPSYQRHYDDVTQMYQTSTAENDKSYSGLLSGIRTGGCRKAGSLVSGEYESTDDGVYFLHPFKSVSYDNTLMSVPYLFYADHDSDTMIALCGRPDCPHDTLDCNAVVVEGYGGVTYYDGHIYVTAFSNGPEIVTLYRMNTDGTNRVAVLDCSSVNRGQYSSYMVPRFQNGVFMIGLCYIDNASGETVTDWYYCKLDGQDYSLKSSVSGYCWNDGEAFLHGAFAENQQVWQLWQWDPDNNTKHTLASLSDMDLNNGTMKTSYWGASNGLAHYKGQILKINYPNGDTEVLFETGIVGENTTRFFPDCIAIHECASTEIGGNGMIHFYDYQGNRLGDVEINIPTNSGTMLILGESRNRIYLGANVSYLIPSHYLDKSEFGNGNIVLHQLDYPDLSEQERYDFFNFEQDQ